MGNIRERHGIRGSAINEVKARARRILLGSWLNWGPFLSLSKILDDAGHIVRYLHPVGISVRRSRFLGPDAGLVQGKILPPIASIFSPRREPDHRRGSFHH